MITHKTSAVLPRAQVPGIYHRQIGEVLITALSDGYADDGIQAVRNIDQAEALAMFEREFRPARRASINCFLVRSMGRIALIDVGCGRYFGESAGQIQAVLAAADVAAEEIDTILLTHVHPDHSGGLTDLGTGHRNFPNARIVVHENELAHWFDDDEMAKASPAERSAFFQTAREQLAPYRQAFAPFSGTEEVFPGVRPVPLFGHTPGHCGYMISSQDQRLLVWGDIIHIPELQIARPDVTLTFDCDQDKAAATRRQILGQADLDGLLVAGAHIHFPGFAHVIATKDSFRLLPEPWCHTMKE